MRRFWLGLCAGALLACGSTSETPGQPAASDAASGAGGSAVAGSGGSAGSAGSGGADAGGGSGTSGAGGSAGAPPRCVDRTSPECQPQTLGPTDRVGLGLTVLGDDIYWVRYGSPPALARTSIADGTTVDLAGPADEQRFYFEQIFAVTNDGTYVYVLTDRCCAGFSHGIFRYHVASGTWSVVSLNTRTPYSIAVAKGTVFVGTYEWIVWYTPDLERIGEWKGPYPTGLSMIVSDGTDVFVAVLSDSVSLAKLENGAPTVLGPVPNRPSSNLEVIAVNTTTLYASSATQIVSMQKAGAAQSELFLDNTPNHALHLIADDETVYFIDEVGLHGVRQISRARERLAAFDYRSTKMVGRIAQNRDHVFWTTETGLSRVRK
jgi:hypothetical protein